MSDNQVLLSSDYRALIASLNLNGTSRNLIDHISFIEQPNRAQMGQREENNHWN